ncbi:MAG: PD40 domain-containing protein [Anaerolineales bacterium]|nr:PD40 domain-containing protein [Anaerolineales bacterium]
MSYLHPKRRGPSIYRIAALLALGAAAGLAAAFLILAPRVVSFSPAAGAHTGSFAAVEVRFSVPMDSECAADHFSVEPDIAGELTVTGDTLRFAPHNPWPAGAEVRASIAAGACSARGLPLLFGSSWTFSPSLVRIAYLPVDQSSGGRLMAVPADGGEPAVLASAAAPIREYDVSRRGDFAVFTAGSSGRSAQLWRTSLDGAEAELLLDCGEDACSDPAISPDGSAAAFVRRATGAGAAEADPSVELIDLAGGEIRRLSAEGHAADSPIWSVQGWLSYYDGTSGAIVVDDLAGGRTLIPNATGSPWSWLPDGSALVFAEVFVNLEGEIEGAASDVYHRLFWVEVKTNRRKELSGTARADDSSPAVSPDGTKLAFARNFFDARWTPGRQLWVMDLAGGALKRLSDSPEYGHSSIRWSPDGARLAFMLFHETAPGDPPEIWRLNADGADPLRLVVGGYLPRWLP